MDIENNTTSLTSLERKAFQMTIDTQRMELQRYTSLFKQLHEETLVHAQRVAAVSEELQQLRQREAALHLSTTWRVMQLLVRIEQKAPRLFKLAKVSVLRAVYLRKMLGGRASRSGANSLALPPSQRVDTRAAGSADVANDTDKNAFVRTAAERFAALIHRDWYLARYPDVAAAGLEPVDHYTAVGADKGYDPNPLFDTDWYQARYPEVLASGLNPLLHYITVGALLGRNPNPLFDANWYQATYADVARSGLTPLEHYLQIGAEQRRNPSSLFDVEFYVGSYPDLAQNSHKALEHFLHYGSSEARICHEVFFPIHSVSSYLSAQSDLQALADLTNEQS
jgi:hypothetical protein